MILCSHLQAWRRKKNSKMASVTAVRHERDPGNVGEPETVMIK